MHLSDRLQLAASEHHRQLSATAACGGDADAAAVTAAKVIRFAFAPDPVWDLMVGHRRSSTKWEEENNARSRPADVGRVHVLRRRPRRHRLDVDPGAPVLEAETNIETVTFGKYNYQRVPMFRRAGDPYETLEDVPKGSKICVSGPTSNTAFWTVLAQEMHGLDYRVGGGDFELSSTTTSSTRPTCCAVTARWPRSSPRPRCRRCARARSRSCTTASCPSSSTTSSPPRLTASCTCSATTSRRPRSGSTRTRTSRSSSSSCGRGHRHVEGAAGRDGREVPPALLRRERGGHRLHVRVHQWRATTGSSTARSSRAKEWVETETAIWDLMKNLDPDNANYLAEDAPTPRFEVLEPSS